MSAPLRLDHVVIHVSERTRANAFYREVLGAEIVSGGGRTAYRFGEQQLNVHGPGVTPAAVARLPVASGNSDLCFVWDGPIGGVVAHLRARGVAIEAGPLARHGARGAGESVYVRDPDGSLIELISYAPRSVGRTVAIEAAAAIDLTEYADRVDRARDDGCPMLLATASKDGAPDLSLRGSVTSAGMRRASTPGRCPARRWRP